MLTGIDVSPHNGNDPDMGADIIGIKASEGMGWRSDEYAAAPDAFRLQVAKARKLGRRVQWYHYTWPAQDVAAEWANFMAVIGPHLQPGDVLVCDWEWSGPKNIPTDAQAAAYKRKWFELARKELPGHKHLLYTNTARWNNKAINPDKAAGDGLWIAEYGIAQGKPNIADPWLGHQWTGAPLDRSVWAFEDLAAYDRWSGAVRTTDADRLAALATKVGELDTWSMAADARLDQLAGTDRTLSDLDSKTAELIASLQARVAELERRSLAPLRVVLTATQEA